MEDFLNRIHEAMQESGNYVDYVHAMQSLSTRTAGEPLPYWCLFAGSGIEVHFKSACCKYLASIGVDIKLQATLFAEREADNRAWLQGQHPHVGQVVADVGELDADTVFNRVDGDPHSLLGPCGGCSGGIPCTSRTTLNKNSGRNVNCVQERREETGLAYLAQERTMEKHSPLMLTNECSAALYAVAPNSKESDAEFMNGRHRAQGYWSYSQIVDSTEWGSPADRLRAYWAAARGIKGPILEVNEFFYRIHQSFRIPSSTYVLEDFICFDDTARRSLSNSLGLPCHIDLGVRTTAHGKKDPEFKLIHMTLFRTWGLHWPVDPAALQTVSEIHSEGVSPRELDLLVFLDNVWPPRPEEPFQSLDINPTLQWVVSPYIVDGEREFKKAADGTQTSPWKPNIRTLVGSGKVAIRFLKEHFGVGKDGDENPWRVRLLDSIEYWRLIGHSDSWYNVEALRREEPTHQVCEHHSRMCGNAFNAWHYIPWFLATLATIGQYGGHEESDDSEQGEDADAEEQDALDDDEEEDGDTWGVVGEGI